MPRPSEPTRNAILNAGFKLFFARGYARVSMDDIAAEAGLTKRTLYYHFDSKDALVGAVLEYQNTRSLHEFARWSDPQAVTATAFVQGLFDQLGRWVTSPGWRGSGFTRLTLELSDLPGHPARLAARRHKRAVEAWIAGELRERGVRGDLQRARAMAILIEGALALALTHSDPDYLVAAGHAAVNVVTSPS